VFAITALIAFGLLGSVGDGPIRPMVVVFSLLFLAQYTTQWRLPQTILVEWIVRAILWVVVIAVARGSGDGYSDYGDPRSFIVIGTVFGLEMVIQCWRAKPARLFLIFCAGIIYLSGCYQNSVPFVPNIAPVFFLVLMLSWRALDTVPSFSFHNKKVLALYATAAIIALGCGFSAAKLVSHYSSDLNLYAQKLLEGQSLQTDAGMSDSPHLGSVLGSEGSTERVLLITGRLPDDHLRAAAFHNYIKGSWGPRLQSREYIAIGQYLGRVIKGADLVQVRKLRFSGGLIYVPLKAAYVDQEVQDASDWSPGEGGPIRSRTPSPSQYTFSASDSGIGVFDQPLHQAALAEDKVIPDDIDRRVVAMAHDITAHCKSDSDKVAAVCTSLDKTHGYSLTYDSGDGDPVSTFILGNKSAHCEYFASAAVILLRCAHVPARYVIGYYAHEPNSIGETVVRQRDAHAWAEAFVNGGWETVDATPGGGRPDKLYDSVPLWTKLTEFVEDRIQLLQDEALNIGPGKIVAFAAVVIAFYIICRAAFKQLRGRRRRTRPTQYISTNEFSAYSERFNNLLERTQIVVAQGETWLEYFERETEVPFSRDDALRFIRAYNAARFGKSGDEQNLTEMLDLLERTENARERL
jgi:transglutaminase-like putative cysteine protease